MESMPKKRIEVSVEEYTTPNPVTANEDTSIAELSVMMKEFGIRHLPIVRGKNVVGIVSERDIKVVAGLETYKSVLIRAEDIMVRDPVTVDAEAKIDEVAFEMSRLKIGSVIVNDGDDLLGIFTVTDALNALIEIIRSDRESQ